MGINASAHKIAKRLEKDEEVNRLLNNYIAGVNTIISSKHEKDYPLEFKLLNYEPELWSSHHVAAVIMAMTYDLCYKHNDVESTLTLNKIGVKRFKQYFPEWNPKQKPIVQKGDSIGSDSIDISGTSIYKSSGKYAHRNMPEEGIGSNNWAVHKNKTAGNTNILANDPHLGLSLPSVWYEMHIHLPEKDIYGVSFPGIPGIVLGFNDQYAWGSTNVSHDVADWYHLIWKDSTYSSYLFEDEWVDVNYLTEDIVVKNADTVSLRLPETVFGIVPYTETDSLLAGCAFQWSPFYEYENGAMNTFIEFNLGNTYEDFKNALPNHKFPAQNFVYADRENIAIHVQGQLPIRKQGEGIFILDSIDEQQWTDFVPQDQLPFEHNPSKGYVSSANQHSTYPSYPFDYHGLFDDYRGRTLDSFLRSTNSLGLEDMKAFQLSTFSLEAKEVVPVLLGFVDSTLADSTDDLQKLKKWDYQYEANSTSASLFQIWWSEVLRLTTDEFSHSSLAMPESWFILELIQTDPNDSLFDHRATAEREDASQIINRAWRQALELFNSKGQPKWSSHKQSVIRHIAQIEAFSSDIIHNGGSGTTLNAMKRTKGPSWRMIVEMGDEIKALGVYPGGQSGNPGSRFYDNQISTWADGKYYPLQLIQEKNDERIIRKWTIKRKQ